jgi:glycosyltransferase involved in cell wall biosynthesis
VLRRRISAAALPAALRDRAASATHMAQPAVSVIIPAYNTAPFIAETLASVFAQTVHDDEVIVVNDGSPDTLEFERAIQPFKNRIRYTVQTNRALSAARNTGIAASRAELVALLDSDDVWEHDYLAWQVDVLRRGRFDIVYPNARPFGDPTRSGRLSWISIRRAAK